MNVTERMQVADDRDDELLPLVDEAGNVVGAATRGECHDGSKLLHPVVHVQVFNSAGDIYLQKRPEWKKIQPGRWDTAVGGHVDFGESILQAVRREASEELGLHDAELTQLTCYLFESEREREMVYVFRATCEEGEISPSGETDGGRFWTRQEIAEAKGSGVLTPNFEYEFDLLRERGLL